MINTGTARCGIINGGSSKVCAGLAGIDMDGKTKNILASCKYNYKHRESSNRFVLFVERAHGYKPFRCELKGLVNRVSVITSFVDRDLFSIVAVAAVVFDVWY